MSYVDRSETKIYSAGAMFAVIGGYTASRFVGAAAWIPALLAIGSFALLGKLLDRNVAVRVAAALLIGQLGWMIAALVVQPDMLLGVWLAIVIDLVVIGLLLFAPTYVSAPIAIAWSVLGIYFLSQQADADPAFARAMLVHAGLRIGIILAAAAMIIFKIHPDLIPDSDQEDLGEEPA